VCDIVRNDAPGRPFTKCQGLLVRVGDFSGIFVRDWSPVPKKPKPRVGTLKKSSTVRSRYRNGTTNASLTGYRTLKGTTNP
jgi:hypothetical protein